jgi:hypothetical protein
MGKKEFRDFSDILAEGGPMVEPLRDPVLFARRFSRSAFRRGLLRSRPDQSSYGNEGGRAVAQSRRSVSVSISASQHEAVDSAMRTPS